jgi:cytoskeletal protein CcmA (bactofilin family)
MNNKRFTDAADSDGSKTFINSSTKIIGEVHGSQEFFLEGELDGKVKLDSLLIVGENGRLKGKIEATDIVVEGKVDGEVVAKNKIEVRHTGNFKGNITCKQIAIADGAFFQGNVKMEDGSEVAPARFKEKREDLKT